MDVVAQRGLEYPAPRGFEALPGGGVTAQVDQGRVWVGNPDWVAAQGVDSTLLEGDIRRLQGEAKTVVVVAVETRGARQAVGLVAFADAPRPDAAEAVARMKERGWQVVLVTGDQEATACAIAAQVGISQVVAQVRPQEKAAHIRAWQAQGHRVVMVGDGINDAPALTQADVGVAMATGTDIAMESADIILVRPRLMGLLEAHAIATSTYRKTLQNLALAFAFNGIGVPLATTGLVHPVWAMVAMVLSVSAVLGNSFGFSGWQATRPVRG